MIDRDLVETLVALALILACALTAIASAQPRAERAPRAQREKRRPRGTGPEVEPEAPVTTPAEKVIAPETAPAMVTGRPRPRFLTGEPGALEPPRPPARRAIALVGGITALAAGGAVGLLVVVRALVAMFKKIG